MTDVNLKDWVSDEDLVLEAKESNFNLPDDGVYPCIYMGYSKKVNEINGERREYLTHVWKIDSPDYPDQYVFQNTSLTLSDRSKLGEIVKALTGEVKAGEKVNLKELVGKKAKLVLIQTTLSNGKTVLKVEGVKPL